MLRLPCSSCRFVEAASVTDAATALVSGLQAEVSSLSFQISVLVQRASVKESTELGPPQTVAPIIHADGSDQPTFGASMKRYQEEKDMPLESIDADVQLPFERPVASPPPSRRAMASEFTLQLASPARSIDGVDEVVSRGQIEKAIAALAEDLQLCKLVVQVSGFFSWLGLAFPFLCACVPVYVEAGFNLYFLVSVSV